MYCICRKARGNGGGIDGTPLTQSAGSNRKGNKNTENVQVWNKSVPDKTEGVQLNRKHKQGTIVQGTNEQKTSCRKQLYSK